MTATKLKNIICKRIYHVENIDVLRTINHILDSKNGNKQSYQLTEIQRKKIANSKIQLKEGKGITNEKVFDEVEKWHRRDPDNCTSKTCSIK